MARSRDADLRISGMGLMPRFALSMTAALSIVMCVAGFSLYRSSVRITDAARDSSVSSALQNLQADPPIPFQQRSKKARRHRTGVMIHSVMMGDEQKREGTLYQLRSEKGELSELLIPAEEEGGAGAFLRVIVALMVGVVFVGAVVALWVANQVSKPIVNIVHDIRQISKGDFRHRTRASGGGEIELLARSIDRMTHELEEAQDAQLELSIRQHEMELAGGVHEALLPQTTPLIDGFDLGASHMSSAHFGGDFHEFINLEDGRVGLLVCDVSGEGIPAALVGATARSCMRAALLRGEPVVETLKQINRELATDLRRGMFVTALYALLDPRTGSLEVASAGHKVPLLRYSASDRKLHLIHPEGLALGIGKGAVFERSLESTTVNMGAGDRLLMANSAPLGLTNPAGDELGEKAFYSLVLRHAQLPTTKFLRELRHSLLNYAESEEATIDVSLVTLLREA